MMHLTKEHFGLRWLQVGQAAPSTASTASNFSGACLQHSLFYDWNHNLKQFGLGLVIKPTEEHRSLARVGYATEPLSYAWITETKIVTSISTDLDE